MPAIRWTLPVATWFLCATVAFAQEIGEPDPLFRSNDVLDVRITAPLRTLLSDRPFEEELPATFQYTNEAGTPVAFDIQVRTRGRFRRQEHICRFPPVRVNFKRSQVKGTLFHKQDKVKLVTHCESSSRYQQVLLREYMVYRVFNVLHDASFRVRLLRITWIDNERDNREMVHFGFLIEHRDRLAKRLDMPVVDVTRTKTTNLDPAYTNITSMFHYMIGNTDFSPIQGAKDEYCCHNHILFGVEGQPWLSVPYDFDQSGFVDAPHAGPNPRFKLRNVRQRLYRGRCVFNSQLSETIDLFQAKRAAIDEMIETTPGATNATKKYVRSYLERFYKTLESDKRINKEFVKACI